jgi:hypothetical protein
VHAGNKFICPICGYKSNGFAKIGKDLEVLQIKKVVGGGPRNAGCYNCGSTPEKNLSRILNEFGFNHYVYIQ